MNNVSSTDKYDLMNTEALIDDEPELVLEDEDGMELSTENIDLIDDVLLSSNDDDLLEIEDLAAVAKVEQLSDVPDLCFESENEQSRLECEIETPPPNEEASFVEQEALIEDDLSFEHSDNSESVEEVSDTVSDTLDSETSEESSDITDPIEDIESPAPIDNDSSAEETLPNDKSEEQDYLDELSINHIEAQETLAPTPESQSNAVSVMPTDSTRLALLESAQLTLNEQINELVNVLRTKSEEATSPTQTPSKQFTTAIYYAKHEKNYYLAAKWFRKAALRGHAKAQFYLGMLFCKGDGVPRSFFHAYSWFSLAACQNIDEAVHARKKLEPALTSYEIQQALRLAADRFEQMAELN